MNSSSSDPLVSDGCCDYYLSLPHSSINYPSDMTTDKMQLRFGVVCLFILAAAFSRLVPHLGNFSPLGAIGLFGAAHFSKKWQAFLIPILATWLSDLFLNNIIYTRYYPEFTWFYKGFIWQYASYLLIAVAGILILRKKAITPPRILGAALTSTAIFFLVSNFGSWLHSPVYPPTLSGLLTCYAAGIPFLKGTMLGDLLFSAVLFGSFALAQKKFPALRLTHAGA